MSRFLPQLIILALGGVIAPPLLLITIFWGSRRPLPNATALGLRYFAICAAMGIAELTLYSQAVGLRAPEDERR